MPSDNSNNISLTMNTLTELSVPTELCKKVWLLVLKQNRKRKNLLKKSNRNNHKNFQLLLMDHNQSSLRAAKNGKIS